MELGFQTEKRGRSGESCESSKDVWIHTVEIQRETKRVWRERERKPQREGMCILDGGDAMALIRD